MPSVIPNGMHLQGTIANDEVFDDDGYFSLISSDLYWFKFVSRRPFSSQTLQEISQLLAIDVRVEDFSECDVHDHKYLDNFFLMMGTHSVVPLK